MIRGLWDGNPVSPGHALLIPRRHIATVFQCSTEEWSELLDGIIIARAKILERHRPDGFNIGINAGEAAGQTVFHLHVHVIPRYCGDVPKLRGGVRHVIPDKADYTPDARPPADPLEGAPHFGSLIQGEEDSLLPHLIHHLSTAREVDMAVAFVLSSGLDRLEGHLTDLLDRGGRLRIITGDYLDVAEPDALRRLLDLARQERQVEVKFFRTSAAAHLPNTLATLKAFLRFVAQVDSSGTFLHEDIKQVRDNFKEIANKFIFKFGDVDRETMNDVFDGLEAYYGFLASRKIVAAGDFNLLRNKIRAMRNVLIGKMERYNVIRQDDSMDEDLKAEIRDELFEGDRAWPHF